jgi:molybdopterin-containing oxidoreductase family membrane subunit
MNNQTDELLLREFAPQLGKMSRKENLGRISGLPDPFRLFALFWQVVKGHIVTGMRDNVFGAYISSISSFYGHQLCRCPDLRNASSLSCPRRAPIIRMAEFITVISLLIGPIFILLCIGRLDRLPNLVLHGRIQSPITWT